MKKLGVFILGIFFVSFVFAAVNAPISLVFENNANALYDEGNFNLNWTSGGGDAETAYTVFVFSNGTLFGSFANDSFGGYSFSNFTEANYSFIIQAENATGDLANSSQVYMQVDNTSPAIILPGYVNGTLKKNSDLLTLNISVTDSLSGLIGSTCIINVNGTNQTVAVISGWCNSSSLGLSGLSDGNKTITIYTNDTINNIGVSGSYVVWMDSTNPIATANCDSSSIVRDSILSCTCSGNDGVGSGINSSLTTPASIPTTSVSGDFSYSCSVTDNVGNTGTSSFSYTVTTPITSSRGGFPTYYPTVSQLSQGYTIILGKGFMAKFSLAGENHILTVDNITGNKVKITVESDPVTFEIGLLGNKEIDLDSDGNYDLNVFLKEFIYGRPNLVLTSIKKIVEEKTGDKKEEITGENKETKEEVMEEIIEKEDKFGKSYWGWILFTILIVAGFVIWKMKLFESFNLTKLRNKFFGKSEYHETFRE